jgi:phosphate-selective porin
MTKSLGCSLLAFAVSASVALANGGEDPKNPTATPQGGGWTYKPGSGLNYDGGDAFGMTLTNQIQLQWQFAANDNAPDTNSFNVRRARTTLAGHAYNKNINYLLRLEHTDTGASIKDAWAQWNFKNDADGKLGVRVGQSKTYHGLEATGSSSGLYFVERSSATRTFTDTRTRGAWVHSTMAENKLRWMAGVQNGDVATGSAVNERGEEVANVDNELNYIASANFDPMGDFVGDGKSYESFKQGVFEPAEKFMGTIGAGVLVGNHRDAGNTVDIESTSVNINTAWRTGMIGLQGEVFLRSDDNQTPGTPGEDTTGWYAQGSYTLEKSGNSDVQWGFGVRIAQVNTDDNVTVITGTPGLGAVSGDVMEVTGVLDAFYHGHSCKTQVEYTWQDVNPDAGQSSTNHIMRIQFTLVF